MSPSQSRPFAVWPDDNINRRIFTFNPRPEPPGSPLPGPRWIRDPEPLFGEIAQAWLGHSYGGNLFQWGMSQPNEIHLGAHAAPTFLFYERVSDKGTADPNAVGTPHITELFLRPLSGLMRAAGPERPVLSVGSHPFPSTARTIGGFLMEGPRPLEVQVQGRRFIVLGFSCGDFPTDSYTANYAWATDLRGPYHPALNTAGTDLMDLGQELKRRFRLSWLGRPSFFRAPDGHYEMLFHAVDKSILPNNDYTHWPSKIPLWAFFRSLYRARVRIDLDPATQGPRIRLDIGAGPH